MGLLAGRPAELGESVASLQRHHKCDQTHHKCMGFLAKARPTNASKHTTNARLPCKGTANKCKQTHHNSTRAHKARTLLCLQAHARSARANPPTLLLSECADEATTGEKIAHCQAGAATRHPSSNKSCRAQRGTNTAYVESACAQLFPTQCQIPSVFLCFFRASILGALGEIMRLRGASRTWRAKGSNHQRVQVTATSPLA
jgi:hypothetical protein